MTEPSSALLTDLYELTMLQGYWAEGLCDEAVFSLYIRSLPESRNFVLACGLDDVLSYLETLRFSREACEYLATLPGFSRPFLAWLAEFRFTGEVRAIPEGTPVFAGEPILEIAAPLPQAQLVETYVMNQIHLQTVIASKAARVVHAASGRRVVDFGLRRAHGADAGVKATRACYIAGVDATSNVLAGKLYGIPVSGTMAHSYVQVHGSELEAFRAFATRYPDTVLLVDTYDTLEGVRNVVRLRDELGEAFQVRAVRLDSGDLSRLSVAVRRMLDEAGLQRVSVFASGGLDEYSIQRLLAEDSPIDGFGVGTRMDVSYDAPAFEMAYKLTRYAGSGRIKLSPGKESLPGRKQVYRREEGGTAVGDLIATAAERHPGRALLRRVMSDGRRLAAGTEALVQARHRAQREIARLPQPIRCLDRADPPYPVNTSPELAALRDAIRRQVAEGHGSSVPDGAGPA
ncbi:MAG: nicotinate phosphoribosyltransferase [Gemmatimonadota bacterium]